MRPAPAWLTVALCLALVAIVSAQSDAGAIAAARAKFDQAKYAEAEQAFRELLRTSPQSQPAMVGLGETLIALHRPGDAVAYLQRAINSDPSDAAAMRGLAHALVDLNDFSRAEGLLTRITETTPGDSEAWFLFGQLLYQSGYYGGANEHLEHALRLAPRARWAMRAEIYRAVCLQKLSAPDAEAALRRVSTKAAAQHDPDLELTIAELLYETGRNDEALARVDAALASDPSLVIGHFWRARILLRLGRLGDAAVAAEQSVRLLPQLPLGHNLLVRIYQMQGRAHDADEQAQWLRDFQQRLDSR